MNRLRLGALLLVPILQSLSAQTNGTSAGMQGAGLAFVENRGQWQAPAQFLLRAGDTDWWLGREGWRGRREQRAAGTVRGVALELRFQNARANVRPRGERPLAGVCNWFLGADPSRWARGVRRYGAVRYPALWDGIDLVLRDQDGQLEYDLELAPGAGLAQVGFLCTGQRGLRIAGDGSLVIATELGELVQKPPAAWTVGQGGSRLPLRARYVLRGERSFGFALDGWDRSLPLVIDPGLVWSTFLGGTTRDEALALKVASNGECVVAGRSASADFPTTLGSYQRNYAGGSASEGDAFVARLAADGAALVWATFVGGANADVANDLHLHGNDAVTCCGTTTSSNFPTTIDAYSRVRNGPSDFCVFRLSANGSQLVYGSYLGGDGDDDGRCVQVTDARDWVHVAGNTRSSNFPLATNRYPIARRGAVDGVCAILDFATTSGQTVIPYASLCGGSGQPGDDRDEVNGMFIDGGGVITLVGQTNSDDHVPATATAPQRTRRSRDVQSDAYITCFIPTLSGLASLAYSTYFGGATGSDVATKVHFHATGQITMVGYTRSSDLTVVNAFRPNRLDQGNGNDAFLVMIRANFQPAQAIVYSSYLGGAAEDRALALEVDRQALQAYVAGVTASPDLTVTPGTQQGRYKGNDDAFLLHLDTTAPPNLQLQYGSYFGGCTGRDEALALVVDTTNGIATLAGRTSSNDLPTPIGALRTVYGATGGHTGFVTRIDLAPLGPAYTTFGSGCLGSAGIPTLAAGLEPQLCLPFSVQLTNLPPNQPAVLTVGFSRTQLGSIPLPLPLAFIGMIGCSLHCTFEVSLAFGSGSGTTSVGFTLPYDPSLVGAKFYDQVFVGDPGRNPAGLVNTNAGEATIRF